jgi:hypothetical protein
MADGPVANIPASYNAPGKAVAGYVNHSGIGVTFPAVVAQFPNAQHLSITTNGSPAMCADVEAGAMNTWAGYDYGYCAVSNVNELISQFGRPRKLWTAHYTGTAHICSPSCWPGLVTTADGTQWTDHGGIWDESLLRDDFFAPPPPAPPTPTTRETEMLTHDPKSGGYWGARANGNVYTYDGAPYIGPLAKYLTQWGIGTSANPVTGIAADGQGGFALLADSGGAQPNIYNINADGRYAK